MMYLESRVKATRNRAREESSGRLENICMWCVLPGSSVNRGNDGISLVIVGSQIRRPGIVVVVCVIHVRVGILLHSKPLDYNLPLAEPGADRIGRRIVCQGRYSEYIMHHGLKKKID